MKERTPRVLGARASPELEIDVASTHIIISIISGIQIFLLFPANFKLSELGINSWLENISHTQGLESKTREAQVPDLKCSLVKDKTVKGVRVRSNGAKVFQRIGRRSHKQTHKVMTDLILSDRRHSI